MTSTHSQGNSLQQRLGGRSIAQGHISDRRFVLGEATENLSHLT